MRNLRSLHGVGGITLERVLYQDQRQNPFHGPEILVPSERIGINWSKYFRDRHSPDRRDNDRGIISVVWVLPRGRLLANQL